MKSTNKVEEDPYAGFDKEEEDILGAEHVREALQTSHKQRNKPYMPPPTTSARAATARSPGTARGATSRGMMGSRAGTAYGDDDGAGNRPLTSMRGAGFSEEAARKKLRGEEKEKSETPQQTNKRIENEIMKLIDECSHHLVNGDMDSVIKKASDAVAKEKIIAKFRAAENIDPTLTIDVTFMAKLNMAICYQSNALLDEAISAYQDILKMKAYATSAKIRTNLGNAYFDKGKYNEAIKCYRKALDHVSNEFMDLRIKILSNIAKTFVKMEQYGEAIATYEHILSNKLNYKSAFQLLLCHYAVSDTENMQKSYQKLLTTVPIGHDKEMSYVVHDNDPHELVLMTVLKTDDLRKLEDSEKKQVDKHVVQGACLISPHIKENQAKGYEWCVETIKQSQYRDIAAQLDISKAVMLLRQSDFAGAARAFAVFEKSRSKIASQACNDLCFMYIYKKDFTRALKYAVEALEIDKYNQKALVNKGNVLFFQGKYDEAEDMYTSALTVDSDCLEAVYNLGLTARKLKKYEEATRWFQRYNNIIHGSGEAIYQLGVVAKEKGDSEEAIAKFSQLMTMYPNDDSAAFELARVYNDLGDTSSAYQYMFEAHKTAPFNISVVSWIAMYFFQQRVYREATLFFTKATMLNPEEVKWRLFIAACQKNSGLFSDALSSYKKINYQFPDNIPCLKAIVKLCSDLGVPELKEFRDKLRRAQEIAGVSATDATDDLTLLTEPPKPKSKEKEAPSNSQAKTGPREYGVEKEYLPSGPSKRIAQVREEDERIFDDADVDLPL